MKTKLLSTAAAALLVSSGIAFAQGKSDTGGMPPERAPPAQRSAPAEKVAPPMNAGQPKAPATTGQGAPQKLEPGSGANTQMKGDTGGAAGMKSSPADKDADRERDMKRSGDQSSDRGAKADDKNGDKAAGAKSDDKAATTGQGAAAGAAKLSTEQRTKITTIIREKKVAPVNLDIKINVGTRVPSTVRFYPVPVEVIEVYPQWRGYDYIIVGSDILILEPDTHVIVAIIAA